MKCVKVLSIQSVYLLANRSMRKFQIIDFLNLSFYFYENNRDRKEYNVITPINV
ncbi:hypothetical protein SAMN04515674_102543 [Pseudarcicella hirudinis]|uniref:Uncharacterized protein n=1 Tax=Pseudarcicella hirudinis TaxID=1079859 RepID=A0A1I5PNY1_9BACT|nr:hypothetical protein SAMN04515674_102543 [Pseudarcicella hirudinis]